MPAYLSAYPDPEDEKLLEEELNTPADSKRYRIILLCKGEVPTKNTKQDFFYDDNLKKKEKKEGDERGLVIF